MPFISIHHQISHANLIYTAFLTWLYQNCDQAVRIPSFFPEGSTFPVGIERKICGMQLFASCRNIAPERVCYYLAKKIFTRNKSDVDKNNSGLCDVDAYTDLK